MEISKKNLKGAIIGTVSTGFPFGIWAYYIVTAISDCRSCGAAVSFGIVLPAIILGFPWGLIWLFALMQLQDYFGKGYLPDAVMVIGFIACIAINGAILGARIARKYT